MCVCEILWPAGRLRCVRASQDPGCPSLLRLFILVRPRESHLAPGAPAGGVRCVAVPDWRSALRRPSRRWTMRASMPREPTGMPLCRFQHEARGPRAAAISIPSRAPPRTAPRTSTHVSHRAELRSWGRVSSLTPNRLTGLGCWEWDPLPGRGRDATTRLGTGEPIPWNPALSQRCAPNV